LQGAGGCVQKKPAAFSIKRLSLKQFTAKTNSNPPEPVEFLGYPGKGKPYNHVCQKNTIPAPTPITRAMNVHNPDTFARHQGRFIAL
jgi:hypothetical protein